MRLVALVLLVVGVAVAIRSTRRGPASRGPSSKQITDVMFRTVLVDLPGEHFYPSGQLTTTSDGSGGKLTAKVGTSLPSIDGDGQLVFFFHNNRFVGWDSKVENMSILQVQTYGPRHFQVTYANYASDDPACCPSLIPISVPYRWSGERFVAGAPPPLVSPVPGGVRLVRAAQK